MYGELLALIVLQTLLLLVHTWGLEMGVMECLESSGDFGSSSVSAQIVGSPSDIAVVIWSMEVEKTIIGWELQGSGEILDQVELQLYLLLHQQVNGHMKSYTVPIQGL